MLNIDNILVNFMNIALRNGIPYYNLISSDDGIMFDVVVTNQTMRRKVTINRLYFANNSVPYIVIDWGDGTAKEKLYADGVDGTSLLNTESTVSPGKYAGFNLTNNRRITHTYAADGTYTIRISNTISGLKYETEAGSYLPIMYPMKRMTKRFNNLLRIPSNADIFKQDFFEDSPITRLGFA